MELIVYNYAPDTGIVKPKMTKLKPTQGFDSQVFVNRAQYTTNTPLFGAIANIFSYVITYYNVKETLTFSRPLVQTIPNRPASITTTVLFTSSGVT